MIEPEILETSGDEVLRVEYPEGAETHGICTCTGIGILNIRKRIGYLAHCTLHQTSLARKIVKDAMAECADPQDIKVCLVGNRPSSEVIREIPEFLLDHQSYETELLEILRESGVDPNNIDNRLQSGTPIYDSSYSMLVETSRLAFTVLESGNDDELWQEYLND